MRIIANSQRYVASWLAPALTDLRKTIDRIYRKRRRAPWENYTFDGRETVHNGSQQNTPLRYFPFLLASLRHFRVANERVSLHLECESSVDTIEQLAGLFRSKEFEQMRGGTLSFYLSESEEPGQFVVMTHGKQEPDGVAFCIHVSQNRNFSDIERRVRFFENALEKLGLSRALTIMRTPPRFRIEVTPPWQLGISGANLDKENPSTFYIGPFDGFGDVWPRVQNMLHSPIVTHIDSVGMSLTMTPSQYEVLYGSLNKLASGWRIGFCGRYADGVDPYTADASQAPDGRFPIITWVNESDPAEIFFEADIVPAGEEKRFLEVHSNCDSIETLLKEMKVTTGLTFDPI